MPLVSSQISPSQEQSSLSSHTSRTSLEPIKATEDAASLKTGIAHINGWNTLRVKTLPIVMLADISVSPPQVIQYLHLRRASKIGRRQLTKMVDL